MALASGLLDAPGGPWNHQFMTTPSGTRVHYVTEGPEDGLPVVLVHGWPDLWFGWRRQIRALSPKYRLIVPDLRGFGLSSLPIDVESYGTKNIGSDLEALLDALEIEKAVFIGHDWGGQMVWRMPLFHPTRVFAVGALCTPYVPPRETYLDLDALVKLRPAFEYQKILANTTNAASFLDPNTRRLFSVMFRRFNEMRDVPMNETILGVKDSLEPEYTTKSTLLSDEEMEFYVKQYTQSGFQSNTNFYATRKVDFDSELGLPTNITVPSLYVGANDDVILTPEMAVGMPAFIPDLEMKLVDKAGHWILWEQTEQVNSILKDWLSKIDALYGPGANTTTAP